MLKPLEAICRLANGMPLALLLAASWVELMSPAEILAELLRSFDLLNSDWADLPPRQRSMRASFDYSWQQLDAPERDILRGLSVFRGSFSLRAARQVCLASPEHLRSLVDKSVVQRLPDGRYELHDLLRQFAAEKLSETPLLARQFTCATAAITWRAWWSGRQV